MVAGRTMVWFRAEAPHPYMGAEEICDVANHTMPVIGQFVEMPQQCGGGEGPAARPFVEQFA